jgi:hypothetical protein
MLIHASSNTAVYYIHPTSLVILSRYLCFVVVAVLIIVATRGRLSYERYERESALPVSRTERDQESSPVPTSV